MEQEFKYVKKCLNCKREYGSNARGQRFCCKECQQNYAKKQKEERRFYSAHKELSRIKARSHSLAVEIARYQCYQQGKEFVCEVCGAPATEVHHVDKDFLNNSPGNLKVLCKKCHAEEHSKIRDTQYKPEFIDMFKDIFKNEGKSDKED